MITTLLFDLDGVVLNFLKAEITSLYQTFENHHIEFDTKREALYHTINRGLWDRFEKGEIDKDRVTIGRFNDFFQAIGIEEDYVAFANEYQMGLAYCYFAYHDAYEVLERLSQKYRIYAVTNGVSFTAINRLQGTDMAKYFLDVFVSEDLHAQKPSLEYFNQVIERIGDFDPTKTVLIGDSLTSDIQGAKNIKVTSIYLNRNHIQNTTHIIPDYEIDTLYQLEALLETL